MGNMMNRQPPNAGELDVRENRREERREERRDERHRRRPHQMILRNNERRRAARAEDVPIQIFLDNDAEPLQDMEGFFQDQDDLDGANHEALDAGLDHIADRAHLNADRRNRRVRVRAAQQEERVRQQRMDEAARHRRHHDQEIIFGQIHRDDFGMDRHRAFHRVWLREQMQNRGGRGRRAFRDNQYYLAAAREINFPKSCHFCSTSMSGKVYLAHLEECRDAAEDFRKKTIEIHKFKSSTWTFHRGLYTLRESCELKYLEAKADAQMIEKMDCRLCKSYDEHMRGGCLTDHMKAAFNHKANKIGGEILANLEQMLELQKQMAVDEMLVKHGLYFESVESFFTDEPADLETEHLRQQAWFEFKERSVNQTLEKTRLIDSEVKKNRTAYERKRDEVRQTIESFANNMVNYISENKNNPDLRRLIDTRKAHPVDRARIRERRAQAAAGEQVEEGEAEDIFQNNFEPFFGHIALPFMRAQE